MICEELDPELILLDVEATTYEDVMKTVGSALIQEGYTKESYIDALIEREKNYPTGLNVSGFGVAIPHADAKHVNKAGIAVATLKNPVTFDEMGGMDGDKIDVKLVFMLAVVDPNHHIDELGRIIEIIQDQEVLARLMNAADKQTIIDIITEKEDAL